ncbi:hypothetical protein [Pontibacillus marinus]|uniref:Uncharacterized protein n=1 Tax=Pontibacillus marinus BH030004 = DSM 16465 TaxID=1385511 RepID=A0A0A5G0B7_9BACI|nr:hypothetical protein [Pontibacillus marinus]KGX86536.1 hypothetical protein N783_12005 [Pontibacillus marinus BH030004 = DSM 16465]
MLTFEEKLAIIESFPELTRNDVSLGRVNFQFEDSVYDKKNVVYRLHPNGNGYVYVELIDDEDYDVDDKGMVNIRNYSEEELRKVVRKSIDSLATLDEEDDEEYGEETWMNDEGHILTLVFDYDLWNIYAGEMLDSAFPTYNEAVDFLDQEGFKRIRRG